MLLAFPIILGTGSLQPTPYARSGLAAVIGAAEPTLQP